MQKNIVVFSDGTGQEGGKPTEKHHNTNVYKLFNMIEDRTERQISFYDRGLGTGRRKLTSMVSGKGMTKNIKECYEFIFENYNIGDQIYLFGFSRGAATIRSLSSFIHMFGILPKSRPELIDEAYNIYKMKERKKKEREKKDKKAKLFLAKNRIIPCKVKFLGVWDTVAALGLPFKTASLVLDKIPLFRHKFHNFTLSPSVENAYHALSIDDERLTFHPVLWSGKSATGQTMKQVWFCGVHTDVGGGYQKHGLSDITLLWMTEKAKDKGLIIDDDHKVPIEQNIKDKMHDSCEGIGRVYRKKDRFWDSDKYGEPDIVIHESVLERKLNKNGKENPPYAPWILELENKTEPWDRDS